MAGEVVHVSGDKFEEEVVSSGVPVLVDFWAPWCGPCRMIAPVLDEVAREYGEKVKVAKVNVDENQSLAGKYGVMSIPTMIVFKGGEAVNRLVGFIPKEELKKHLDSLL